MPRMLFITTGILSGLSGVFISIAALVRAMANSDAIDHHEVLAAATNQLRIETVGDALVAPCELNPAARAAIGWYRHEHADHHSSWQVADKLVGVEP